MLKKPIWKNHWTINVLVFQLFGTKAKSMYCRFWKNPKRSKMSKIPIWKNHWTINVLVFRLFNTKVKSMYCRFWKNACASNFQHYISFSEFGHLFLSIFKNENRMLEKLCMGVFWGFLKIMLTNNFFP